MAYKKILSFDEIEAIGINGPRKAEDPAAVGEPGVSGQAKGKDGNVDGAQASVPRKRRGRPRRDALPEGADPDGFCRIYATDRTKRMLADMKMLFRFRERREMSMCELVEMATESLFRKSFPEDFKQFEGR